MPMAPEQSKVLKKERGATALSHQSMARFSAFGSRALSWGLGQDPYMTQK
jgi:hypothetical protein